MSFIKAYFKDIRLKNGKIWVGTTGAQIDIDRVFLKDVWAVTKIFTYLKFRQIGLWLRGLFKSKEPSRTIAFFPQIPSPWFNIWQVSRLANLTTQIDLETADYIMCFEDSTHTRFKKDELKSLGKPLLNFNTNDISKDYVAEVFLKTFGYPLSIDPTQYKGLAIRKSDANGTHDGVVIECPITPDALIEGQSYQRLVDSTFTGKTSEDLRVAYVLGELALVYHKHKPLDDRFGTHYLSVDVLEAEAAFSSQEIKQIKAFCSHMKLDFGAVDVMRDKNENRIYIVDVNKTCMPVLSLKLKTQIACQQKIANVLLRGLAQLKNE